MTTRMRVWWPASLGLALVVGLAGCEIVNWVDEAVNPPPPRIEIGKRTILVLPFAADEVAFKHRGVDDEVAGAVVAQLKPLLPGAKWVSRRDLDDYLAQHPRWHELPASQIAKDLNADIVIELNIKEFQTRDRADGVLLQGRLVVESVVSESDGTFLWVAGGILARWPRSAPAQTFDTSESTVRGRVIALWAENFAELFFTKFEE